MNENVIIENEGITGSELLLYISESADRDLRRYASRFYDGNLI